MFYPVSVFPAGRTSFCCQIITAGQWQPPFRQDWADECNFLGVIRNSLTKKDLRH